MSSISDHRTKEAGSPKTGDVIEALMHHDAEDEGQESFMFIAKQRQVLAEWLNSMFPSLGLPLKSSNEELRSCLSDGIVLCWLLNRLRPGSGTNRNCLLAPRLENIKRFLAAMDEMGIPKFEVSDLEEGSMKPVINSLLTLRAHFMPSAEDFRPLSNSHTKSGNPHGGSSHSFFSALTREEKQLLKSESKYQCSSCSSVSEPSGQNFGDVFQPKQGRYTDLPASKISEMMIDNAPTQSLLSIINGFLDESIERKNGEIPHSVARLLRKIIREIELRISTLAEHIRTQTNIFKAREEKYQSRIRVLEALAQGNWEETENVDILELKKELETINKRNELHSSEGGAKAMTAPSEAEEKKIKELEDLLDDLRRKVKALEVNSSSRSDLWNKKEQRYQSFIDSQSGALQELRLSSHSFKQVISKAKEHYSEELKHLGLKLKPLTDAAENFHTVLAENRKMFNEIQDLKGNIRVFCRVRPFLPGQNGKQTTIDYIGDNGELVLANPCKPGKEGHRLFKFNKVFGAAANQVDVYSETQTFIRSVVDGYNVCIFAYGQTGSGKTYTMTGPKGASEKDWGVNYRALNDLFGISQKRKGTYDYDVAVQMVEIYNEQVRDLLSSGSSQSKLGILTGSQPNGLAVPDATMRPVNSTSDVVELMDIGLKNRAVGTTAMNERSSRSHSIVIIHVRGTDLKTGSSLRGSLHLVDLAGSERVDRSEVTGDRLKEAQHINKSLSALGDVISALSQKSHHIPYRNSKLTQVLQNSLGGQAKTLMFVQLNPDAISYPETLSTLKFAERASGVELGAARTNKEGKDTRELMEQVASLKETIAKKDGEIERLQMLKGIKVSPGATSEKLGTRSRRFSSLSPSRDSVIGSARKTQLGDINELFEADSQHSLASLKHQKQFLQQETFTGIGGQGIHDNFEPLFYEDGNRKERSEGISVSRRSIGTETDDSATNILSPARKIASENLKKPKSAPKILRSFSKHGHIASIPASLLKETTKISSLKKAVSSSNMHKSLGRWH